MKNKRYNFILQNTNFFTDNFRLFHCYIRSYGICNFLTISMKCFNGYTNNNLQKNVGIVKGFKEIQIKVLLDIYKPVWHFYESDITSWNTYVVNVVADTSYCSSFISKILYRITIYSYKIIYIMWIYKIHLIWYSSVHEFLFIFKTISDEIYKT